MCSKVKRPPSVKIPNNNLARHGRKAGTVLAYLMSCAGRDGRCFPTRNTIAKAVGYGKATSVDVPLAYLRQERIISVLPRRGTSHWYSINEPTPVRDFFFVEHITFNRRLSNVALAVYLKIREKVDPYMGVAERVISRRKLEEVCSPNSVIKALDELEAECLVELVERPGFSHLIRVFSATALRARQSKLVLPMIKTTAAPLLHRAARDSDSTRAELGHPAARSEDPNDTDLNHTKKQYARAFLESQPGIETREKNRPPAEVFPVRSLSGSSGLGMNIAINGSSINRMIESAEVVCDLSGEEIPGNLNHMVVPYANDPDAFISACDEIAICIGKGRRYADALAAAMSRLSGEIHTTRVARRRTINLSGRVRALSMITSKEVGASSRSPIAVAM